MKERHLGAQLLVEFYDCCAEVINCKVRIREAMLEAARLAKATIVADVFHEFNPHGLSGVVVIAESHFAIHSWPEHRCASVDLFTCSEGMDSLAAVAYLKLVFKAERMEIKKIHRGNLVEIIGIEPTTSCMPCKRSPS